MSRLCCEDLVGFSGVMFFEEALDALQVCSRFLWEAAHGFTSPFFRLDSYMSTKIYEQSCEKNPTKCTSNGSVVGPEWDQPGLFKYPSC